MQEHEWFVSLLSGADMRKVRSKVSGFPPDLANPRQLKEELIKVFTRGPGPKNPRLRSLAKMNLRDLYTKIAEDYLAFHPEIKAETFELFVVWLQGQMKIRPYEKITLLYHFYAERLNQSLELLMQNAEQKKELLDGLISDELTPKDRIGALLGLPNAAERGEHLREIRRWVEERLPDSQKWQCEVEELEDDQLPDVLQAHENENRWILLLNVLLAKDRYVDPAYVEWMSFVIVAYDRIRHEEDRSRLQKQEQEQQKAFLEIESLTKQQREIACTLDNVHIEKERLQKEVDGERSRLMEAEEETKVLQHVLSAKNNQLEVLTHAHGDYQHFLSLLHDKYDLTTIICLSDQSDFFAARFFQLPVIRSIKELPKDVSLVLIDRTAFPSSSDYLKLCRALNSKGVSYHEVTSYDEITHIKQILNRIDMEGYDVKLS